MKASTIVALSLIPVSLITAGLLLLRNPAPRAAGAAEWKNFTQALDAAKASRKKILVDVYTDWCGWCRKMDKDTYADPGVQAYLADHFELAKLDAESKEVHGFKDGRFSEKEIAAAFQVDGYPTTIFLTPEAEMITSVPGYLAPKTFRAILEYIQTEEYKKTNWQEFSKRRGIAEE